VDSQCVEVQFEQCKALDDVTIEHNPSSPAFLHVVYSGGKGLKYQVSIWCLPSSTHSMLRTFVTSSCYK
jgi:hypothetical protein